MFGKKKNTKTEDSAASTETVTTENVEAAEATEATEATEAIAEATDAAVETATDAMTVSTEDMEALNRFRLAGEDCIKELGNMEIRKARIIASYGQLENASQQKLMEIGAALGIAEGTGWSVNPDGTVTVHNATGTVTESEAATAAE